MSLQDNEIRNCSKLDLFDQYSKEKILCVEYVQDYDKSKLKNPIPISARVLELMQGLPLAQIIKQDKLLKGAYKIVVEEGVTGRLMQYKNGLLGTPMIGKDNKIVGHAGLEKIDRPSINFTSVFTVASLVTGQYFMHQINKSLKQISKDLDEIKKDTEEIKEILISDKDAKIYAIYKTYGDIINNKEMILQYDDLRSSNLTNIKKTITDLEGYMFFYRDLIKRRVNDLHDNFNTKQNTEDRIRLLRDSFYKINDFEDRRLMCALLYMQGRILEIQLSGVYEYKYLEKTLDELKKFKRDMYSNYLKKSFNELFDKKIIDKMIPVIDVWKKEHLDEKRNSSLWDIKKTEKRFDKISNDLIGEMNKFVEFNKRKNEFIVSDGKLYLIE